MARDEDFSFFVEIQIRIQAQLRAAARPSASELAPEDLVGRLPASAR
jgi:hypothetical protein